MRKLARSLAVAGLLAATAALFAAVAAGHNGDQGQKGGDHRGGELINASLAPSVPSDPALHGVSPGGAPWVLRRGEVRLKQRGRLKLELRGLVIPSPPGDGTPGPVQTVSASLYCGADSNTVAADSTPTVPISSGGDARIRDRSFGIPSTCLAPLVLVHPNGDPTRYIAVQGSRP